MAPNIMLWEIRKKRRNVALLHLYECDDLQCQQDLKSTSGKSLGVSVSVRNYQY